MNKPWYKHTAVISAIVGGLFIILAAIITPFITHWLSSSDKETPNVTQKSQLQSSVIDSLNKSGPSSNLISILYPDSIINEIDKSPPYQRISLIESYKGLRVRWQTTLHSIHTMTGNMIHLMLLDRDHDPFIFCDVSLNDYPEFKVMKESTKILVTGTISEIRGGTINLIDVELKY